MRISDWSSDVCSSDLPRRGCAVSLRAGADDQRYVEGLCHDRLADRLCRRSRATDRGHSQDDRPEHDLREFGRSRGGLGGSDQRPTLHRGGRSEEHTSELQSLMRTSYAVFCLKNKKKITTTI